MTAAGAGAAGDASATALYRRVSERAASLDVGISPEELAELAVRLDMGGDEPAALEAVFAYLADKRHDQVISTLFKLSRLPQRAPKTFEVRRGPRRARARPGMGRRSTGGTRPPSPSRTCRPA